MVRAERSIDVVPGVFAAGHLGELTALVPFELVDGVLEATGCVQRRTRMLPSRVGVYLVLAMVLFPQVGLVGVWSPKPPAARDNEGGEKRDCPSYNIHYRCVRCEFWRIMIDICRVRQERASP